MKNPGTSRKREKMAAAVLLPLCIFTGLFFRNPANHVATADMPGGISRYLGRRPGTGLLSGHLCGQMPVPAPGLAVGIF